MAIIKGKYLDGKSSKPNTVDVKLNPHFIEFSETTEPFFSDKKAINERWAIHELEDIAFSRSNTIHIKYGKFPFQNLMIEAPKDIKTFSSYYPSLQQKNHLFESVLKGNPFKVLIGSAVVLIAIVVTYFYLLAPIVANKIAVFVPKNVEIQLGNQTYNKLAPSLDINEQKSAQLNDFFDALGFQSQYPVEIYLSDKKMVNACALPGGKMIFFQGILDKMDSWEELAGVMAHELAHIEQRHSLKTIAKQLSSYLAISAITSDLSGVSAVLFDASLNINSLSNSRSQEREADEIGFQYLINQNIDPQGMIDLFGKINTPDFSFAGKKGKKAFEYLSSHPLTEKRIQYLEEQNKTIEQKQYLDRPQIKRLFHLLKS